MYSLTVCLCLSFFIVTQTTDLSSELNQPLLSESVYVFVVTSHAPIDDIKASFTVTGPPRHSFRVIGENTYYFVLGSNSTTALRQLTFPEGSAVTQYPVVHIYDYLKMFGFETGFGEDDTEEALPDTVLTCVEKYYDFPKGTPVQLYDLITSGLAKESMAAHSSVAARVIYVPVAYYPPKVIHFSRVDDNALQYISKDDQDITGGIGVMNIKLKHIVKI